MKIKGNTVGTPMPRTNYNQTDPSKADYLVGRDNIMAKDDAPLTIPYIIDHYDPPLVENKTVTLKPITPIDSEAVCDAVLAGREVRLKIEHKSFVGGTYGGTSLPQIKWIDAKVVDVYKDLPPFSKNTFIAEGVGFTGNQNTFYLVRITSSNNSPVTITATPNESGDGAKGEKGDPGYTPIKGLDYFDGEKGEKGDPGYTPIKGIDYFDGEKGDKGEKGDPGTSITITGVSESDVDGGENVVTFSDGNTLTVRNGTKGEPGEGGGLEPLVVTGSPKCETMMMHGSNFAMYIASPFSHTGKEIKDAFNEGRVVHIMLKDSMPPMCLGTSTVLPGISYIEACVVSEIAGMNGVMAVGIGYSISDSKIYSIKMTITGSVNPQITAYLFQAYDPNVTTKTYVDNSIATLKAYVDEKLNAVGIDVGE